MKTVLLILLVLVAMLLTTGCHLLQPKVVYTPDTVETVITKTNWLVTVAIIGIALSVVAFINGSRFAIPAFVGCCVALGVTLAVIKYAAVIALGSMVLAGGVCVYTIFVKTRAIKELVAGGEIVKAWSHKPEDADNFDNLHRNQHSKATQQIVKKVKNGGNNGA
jgi:hypothetical protein